MTMSLLSVRRCVFLLAVVSSLCFVVVVANGVEEEGSKPQEESTTWFQWIFALVLFLIKGWAFILFLFLLVVWWIQNMFVYMPNMNERNGDDRLTQYNEKGFRSVSDWDRAVPHEEHFVPTVDGDRVHVWLLLQKKALDSSSSDSKVSQPAPSSPSSSSSSSSTGVPTVLFFHGNAGNIGYRLPLCADLYKFVQCNVVMAEYRGFGSSSGSPSEINLTRDAESVLRWLVKHPLIDSSRVFVYGRSLGGAVSISLCHKSQHLVRGLVLENTFTSITDMGISLAQKLNNKWLNKCIRFLPHFLFLFLLNKWHSESRIGAISIPILFISGLQDELIPPAQMERLFQLATASINKKLYTVANGTHNDTNVRGGMQYLKAFRDFIQSTEQPQTT